MHLNFTSAVDSQKRILIQIFFSFLKFMKILIFQKQAKWLWWMNKKLCSTESTISKMLSGHLDHTNIPTSVDIGDKTDQLIYLYFDWVTENNHHKTTLWIKVISMYLMKCIAWGFYDWWLLCTIATTVLSHNALHHEQIGKWTQNLKGTSHNFIFQISIFSTLVHIFAYLETPHTLTYIPKQSCRKRHN